MRSCDSRTPVASEEIVRSQRDEAARRHLSPRRVVALRAVAEVSVSLREILHLFREVAMNASGPAIARPSERSRTRVASRTSRTPQLASLLQGGGELHGEELREMIDAPIIVGEPLDAGGPPHVLARRSCTLGYVATAEEWTAVTTALRGEVDPFASPHLPRLYQLAVADGPRFLSSFRRRLGDERILDLVYDMLAVKVEAIIAADEPRALFCTALRRRAISWLRRGDAAVVEASEDDAIAPITAEDDRHGFLLDAKDALAGLPARERAIVVAVAFGEDREAIAREFGTSRANVDQIVSRVRKRLVEEIR